jgi:hypothetical protein
MMPFMHLLGVGMIAASAREAAEKAQAGDAQILRDLVKKAEGILERGCADIEKAVPCDPISIKALVSVQLESGLTAAMAAQQKP